MSLSLSLSLSLSISYIQSIDPFVEVEIIGLPVDCCKEQTRVVDDNGQSHTHTHTNTHKHTHTLQETRGVLPALSPGKRARGWGRGEDPVGKGHSALENSRVIR